MPSQVYVKRTLRVWTPDVFEFPSPCTLVGHRWGFEFWRLKEQTIADKLTQGEFNRLLRNPDLYQTEDWLSNRSHMFEMRR